MSVAVLEGRSRPLPGSRPPWIPALLAIVAAHAVVLGQDETEPERPKYDLLRFREDWSSLAGRESDDPLDALKYIRIDGDGVAWLSLGGQARSRVESWSGFGFGGAGERDDTFWLNRLRYHADLHVTRHVRVFIEGKNSFSTDRDLPGGRRTTDVDELALQNAFADITAPLGANAWITLRAGRRELLFGNQRLVSPRDWSNVRRTWDGASAELTLGGLELVGFWSQLVREEKYRFNSSDAGTQFYGLHGTGKLRGVLLDGYFLGVGRDNAAFNGTAGREDRFTVGGRVLAKVCDALALEVESAYQFGEVGAGDVTAFMVATEASYAARLPARPRLVLGFDYASGDGAAGGNVETFSQLFPTGHKYFGYMDTIGRQNIIDVSPGVELHPTEKLSASLRWHFFWRASADDALYNAGAGVVRGGMSGNSREIGSEMDLAGRYEVDRHLFALLGYSRFFAGRFVEQSGASSDIDFVYLMLQYTF